MKSAIISKCGTYRYELRRKIGDSLKECLFIMCNPSTADANQDDPTIRRCIRFAQSWGCGELIVVNLFAYRVTKPDELLKVTDPVGPENHTYVTRVADEVLNKYGPYPPGPGIIVCAWGTMGNFMDQGETVMGWLERKDKPLYCLGITKDGNPKHPLYLKSDANLVEYKGKP